jgi:preprotein translocase subunit SecD
MYKIIATLLILFVACQVQAQNHRNGLCFQLADTTVDINKKDIEQMQVATTTPGYAVVLLKLRPSATKKLHKLTEKALGQSMIWIWNGRVLSMVTLQSPLDSDVTVSNFTSQEAEQFRSMYIS